MPTNMSEDPVELRDILHSQNTEHEDGTTSSELQDAAEANATSLPPADGGIAAWRLLIAAFVFEALLWGSSSDDN